MNRWLAFDDLGEVRGVKQLYTCVAFPPNNEAVSAKTHLLPAAQKTSLYSRFLYALLEPANEPGIDHRTCCGTDNPDLCSIEVHLAHVRPADVLSAQMAAQCSAGPLADELVLYMPTDDAFDAPEPTVDDIHSALRLCRKRLWILCPSGSRPEELLQATLNKRGRRPYTQLVSILQCSAMPTVQARPVRQYELPPNIQGLHYHSIGLTSVDRPLATRSVGLSGRQMIHTVNEFMRGTCCFLQTQEDGSSDSEFGGGGQEVCLLDERVAVAPHLPSAVQTRAFPPIFHCLSRRALDSMTLHELNEHVDGRLAALYGSSLTNYPPNNRQMNRISSIVSGLDDITLAERESVGVAALCMAVRSLGKTAERWLVDAEAELFKRRFSIVSGPIDNSMVLLAYADNVAAQSALQNCTELANTCASVHCERIGAFIQLLPPQLCFDADANDALFLEKIVNIREKLRPHFL